MILHSVASLLILTAVRASAEFNWEFGNWSPILGKCKSCERGRVVFLESAPQESSNKITVQESRNKRRHVSTNGFSFVPVGIFPRVAKPLEEQDDTDRVQLVYLPEGSINDLRTAQVAKVEDISKIQIRTVRSAPYYLSPFQHEPRDLETSHSTISFREVSPRRPMALVAERGKEKEAHEQIQLLEAALSSKPNNVREGDLPRVFIAPTHLPPPPGYVKIPLLPSQNHVERRKTLPRTFLTSEFHKELPPGFIQVPLPERVAQLSHGIPFVNPETNSYILSQIPQEERQRGQQQDIDTQNLNKGHQRSDDPRTHSNFNIGQPIQEDSRTQQDFNSGQTVQQDFIRGQPAQQDFSRDQFLQQDLRTQQGFNRGQPVEEHSRSQPDFSRGQSVQQDFNRGQPVQDFSRGQSFQQDLGTEQGLNKGRPTQEHPRLQQDFSGVPPRDEQNVNINPLSPVHANFQTPIGSPPRTHSTTINRPTQEPEGLTPQRPRQRIIPTPVNEETSRQQFISGHDSQTEENPRVDPPNDIRQPSFKQDSNPFFEIGTSVIQPPSSFPDYSSFSIPDYGLPDYEQDFDVYDNQEFKIPDRITKAETETPFDNKNALQTPEQETPLETPKQPTLTSHPDTSPDIQLNNRDHLSSAPQSEDTFPTEPSFKATPIQLSPRPRENLPALSPSPVKSNSVQPPEQVTDNLSDFQVVATPPTTIQLSPKPINEVADPVLDNMKTGQPVRPNARRRLRPGNSRVRIPTLTRHRLNLHPTEKLDILKVATSSPLESSTKKIHSFATQPALTISPTTLRSRFHFNNRRRRPIRKETNSVQKETSNVIPATEETSTLFPPFSVAKRLKEKNSVSHSTQAQSGRRRESLLSKRRFGSRIRPKIQEMSDKLDTSNAATDGNADETVSNAEEQVPRRRRLRQRGRLNRVRGRNGRPIGQRRRRVLNRVRKVNPATSDNSLIANHPQKDNELRGAESARVLFSEAPANQVSDPIAQTLKLINHKAKSTDGESGHDNNLKIEEVPKQKSSVDENPALSAAANLSTEKPENIFSLLNLEIPNQESVVTPTIKNDANADTPLIHLNVAPFETNIDGYVNDKESFSSHFDLHHSLDEFNSTVVPIDTETVMHDNNSSESPISNTESDLILSPFDSIISYISHTSNSSKSTALRASISDTHVETQIVSSQNNQNSQNQLKHSVPQSTHVNEDDETLSYTVDNYDNIFDTFLPENTSSHQDNRYDDYDTEGVLNNGTYQGSSAHVIYAVALSEPSPEQHNERDFTTQPTDEEEEPFIITESNFLEKERESQTDVKKDEANIVTENSLQLTINSELSNRSFAADSELIHEISVANLKLTNESFTNDTKPTNESSALDSELIHEISVANLKLTNESFTNDTKPTNESSALDSELIHEISVANPKLTNESFATDTKPTNESSALDSDITEEGSAIDSELTKESSLTADSEFTNKNFSTDTEPTKESSLSGSELMNESSTADIKLINEISIPDSELTDKNSAAANIPQNKNTASDSEPTSESSTLDVELTNESSLTDSELTNESSALDIELTNESSALDIELTNESSALDVELTNESSALDIELTNESSALDVELTNESSALDVELTNESSATDSQLTNESSAFDVALTNENSAFDVALTTENSATDSKLTTENSATDSKLTTENSATDSKLTNENSAIDSKLTNENSATDSKLTNNSFTNEDTASHSELKNETASESKFLNENSAAHSEPTDESFTVTDTEPPNESSVPDSEPINKNSVANSDQMIEKVTMFESYETEVTTENVSSDNATDHTPNLLEADSDKEVTSDKQSTKTSTVTSSTLPSSFLDTFFSKTRKSKHADGNDVINEGKRVIGQSTITEVRSSVPVICIEGNCVIGSGIRRKRNS